MKSIHHLILGFSVLLLVAACGPSRYTSTSFNLASVPEYAFIQPYSYIILYGDDGKGCHRPGPREADRVVHFVKEVPTLASHPEESADVSELLHKLLKEFIH